MKKKILIIEDEQTLVKALFESFSDDGYEVETAVDGDEGWKKIKEFKPALILLDLILPKVDGFEVLSRIKRDSEAKDTPVIILTNLSDMTDKCESLGAIHCLVKSDESIENIKKAVRDTIG